MRADADTTAQIRLLDPNVVSPDVPAVAAEQAVLLLPRAPSPSTGTASTASLRDTVIAVRGLNLSASAPRTARGSMTTPCSRTALAWSPRTATRVEPDGRPSFYQSGIPSEGELGEYEPRIYFGTGVPGYSIVGAPQGHDALGARLSRDDNASGQVNNTYTGDGGPKHRQHVRSG